MPPNKTTRMTKSPPRLRQSIRSIMEEFPEYLRRANFQRQVEEAILMQHQQQIPLLNHAIKSSRHLTEVGRRTRTLTRVDDSLAAARAKVDTLFSFLTLDDIRKRRRTEAGRQATNLICTNIKSQSHLEEAGRHRRTLTKWDDEIKQILDTYSVLTRIGQEATNSLKEEFQKDINRFIQPLENLSVRFNNSYHPSCTSPRRKVKRLQDDVRRTSRKTYYHQEDFECFTQEQAQGVDKVYIGRPPQHGAASKKRRSHAQQRRQ